MIPTLRAVPANDTLSPESVDALLSNSSALEPIEQDLAALNYEYLRLVRERANQDLIDSAVRFGIPQKVLAVIAKSSLQDLRRIAEAGLAVFRIAPRSASAWEAAVEGRIDVAVLVSAHERAA